MGWRTISTEVEIDLDDYRDEIIAYLKENPEKEETETESRFNTIVNDLFFDIHSIRLGHKKLDVEYLQDLHDKLEGIING